MTVSIIFVLATLAAAVLFFVTEWLRVDLVAFSALLILAVFGIITHDEALAGFSNHAVVTIAAVLVLSAGLVRTGVAQIVGQQILKLAGKNEGRLMVVIMVTVGLFSGIMNNIGVAALLLPVVISIAHATKNSPSRLLIPLAFASLLGGLTTLIGTAPNLLISGTLQDAGFRPYNIFDFTPLGLVVLSLGILYMVTLGKRLLPHKPVDRDTSLADIMKRQYELQARLQTLTIPEGSPLTGKNLAESRLGSAIGFNVLAIIRREKSMLAPGPNSELQEGDKLLVEGRVEQLETLRNWKHLELKRGFLLSEHLIARSLSFAEIKVKALSPLLGRTLIEAGFRRDFNVNILAIQREDHVKWSKLREYRLHEDDVLVAMGFDDKIEALAEEGQFTDFQRLSPRDVAFKYKLHRQIMGIAIPEGSALVGKNLGESHLKDALGINVLGIARGNEVIFIPGIDFVLEENDIFIVLGQPQNLDILAGLQELILEDQREEDLDRLESDEVGVAEIILAPRTSVLGKTIGELDFREEYGLTVLAIWRQDRAYRTALRDMVLQPGDALLVYGAREDLAELHEDQDFLVLTGMQEEIYDKPKAPIAAGIELSVLATVGFGLLPIYIAAPVGAALMVLTRCLTMEDFYRAIEWKAIFLIASMLGVGLAMQKSGATALIAHSVLGSIEFLGPLGIIAGIFIITALAAQIMPTAVVAVIMAPIALSTALEMSYSPHALLMVVALGASSAFLSPVGHPVNLLVMGLGGYRFTDYTKVGLPLVLLLLLISLFLLPIFWPLT